MRRRPRRAGAGRGRRRGVGRRGGAAPAAAAPTATSACAPVGDSAAAHARAPGPREKVATAVSALASQSCEKEGTGRSRRRRARKTKKAPPSSHPSSHLDVAVRAGRDKHAGVDGVPCDRCGRPGVRAAARAAPRQRKQGRHDGTRRWGSRDIVAASTLARRGRGRGRRRRADVEPGDAAVAARRQQVPPLHRVQGEPGDGGGRAGVDVEGGVEREAPDAEEEGGRVADAACPRLNCPIPRPPLSHLSAKYPSRRAGPPAVARPRRPASRSRIEPAPRRRPGRAAPRWGWLHRGRRGREGVWRLGKSRHCVRRRPDPLYLFSLSFTPPPPPAARAPRPARPG